jgi:hypothetical protein
MRGHLQPNHVAKRNFSQPDFSQPDVAKNSAKFQIWAALCRQKSPAAKNCLVAVFLGVPVIFSQCLFVIITWGHVPLGLQGVLLLR